MSRQADIAILDAEGTRAVIDELADVLTDCAAGGASVNFMHPFSHADAKKYFEKVIPDIARGETILLGARLDGRLVGTVQLGLDTPPNQRHRADVKKLLVHRSARGRGIGIGVALMQHVEAVAKTHGRTLLTLDTASAEAERLYRRAGWPRLGAIPDYAMWPGGGFCDTVIFWKKL